MERAAERANISMVWREERVWRRIQKKRRKIN